MAHFVDVFKTKLNGDFVFEVLHGGKDSQNDALRPTRKSQYRTKSVRTDTLQYSDLGKSRLLLVMA